MRMERSSRICDWSGNNDCSIAGNSFIKDLNCSSLGRHRLLLSFFFALKVATYAGRLRSQWSCLRAC
jgi:hypothetical protein